MSAVRQEATVPAFPLGRPVDGRERFGMTPEQAHVYRWLVENRPHDRPFSINYRAVGLSMAAGISNIHMRVWALCERGWLERVGLHYRFVHPVKVFRG
jgi:hypothetical protein